MMSACVLPYRQRPDIGIAWHPSILSYWKTREDIACFDCWCDSTVWHRGHVGAERKHDERRQLGQWLDGQWLDGWLWRDLDDPAGDRRRRFARLDLQARRQVTE